LEGEREGEREREKGGREKGKGSNDVSFVKPAQLNAPSKADDSHNAFLPYRYYASFLINARQTKFRSAEIRVFHSRCDLRGYAFRRTQRITTMIELQLHNLRVRKVLIPLSFNLHFYCNNCSLTITTHSIFPRKER